MDTEASIHPRKRRRIALACEPCRKKKIKCDQTLPCNHCKRSKKDSCHYLEKDRKSSNNDNTSTTPSISTDPNSPAQQKITILNRLHEHASSHALSIEGIGLPSPRTEIESSAHGKNDERSLPDSIPVPSDRSINRAVLISTTRQDETSSVRGMFSKSRFYGQSHWAHSIHQSTEVFKAIRALLIDEQNGILDTFIKCKVLARSLKTQALIDQPLQADPRDYVLPKEKTDMLFEAYLRTFQTVYHVLHIPSFKEEYEIYWNDPAIAKQDFVMQLLLVMAIGSAFTATDEEVVSQKATASQWIYTVQYWLSSPFEKSRMNTVGIRVHCLLLLARQVNSVGGDLIVVSAGSLLNTAMTVGLHVDPSHTDMPQFDADIRRRLWATVLEIYVQSAMDIGVKPVVTSGDYDCNLPDDALTESLPIRLEIARYINDFSTPFTHDEALRLGAKLTSVCRKNPDTFQGRLVDLLTLRFLLSLHYPFAMKAKTDPKFHYSRKVSLQVSTVLSQASGDYGRLLRTGGATFRGTPVQAISIIADELIEQLGDILSSKSACQDMRRMVEEHVELTTARIKFGETSVKGHVIFSGLLAQVDSIGSGTPRPESISKAVVESLNTCYSLLDARMQDNGTKVIEPQNFDSIESWFGNMEAFM